MHLSQGHHYLWLRLQSECWLLESHVLARCCTLSALQKRGCSGMGRGKGWAPAVAQKSPGWQKKKAQRKLGAHQVLLTRPLSTHKMSWVFGFSLVQAELTHRHRAVRVWTEPTYSFQPELTETTCDSIPSSVAHGNPGDQPSGPTLWSSSAEAFTTKMSESVLVRGQSRATKWWAIPTNYV